MNLNKYVLALVLQASLGLLLINTVSSTVPPLPDMMNNWKNITAHPLLNWTQPVLDYFDSLVEKASQRNASGPYCHTRMEYRLMSHKQFKNFTDAVKCLQSQIIDPATNLTKYQLITGWHRIVYSPSAHGGPCFPAWHAIYLLVIETALQECNPTVCIPVADFRPDYEMIDHCDAPLLTSYYMGNAHGIVETGPFAGYPVYPSEECAKVAGTTLARACETLANQLSPLGLIYGNFDDWDNEYNLFTWYGDTCSPCYPNFEGLHGYLHSILGGHITDLSCAFNDPIFLCLHAFVDYLFNWFRTKFSYPDIDDGVYPTDSTFCTSIPPYHHGTDNAFPFTNYTCADGLQVANKHNITYVMIKNKCTTDSDCNIGPDHINAFYCNTAKNRCTGKAILGGKCKYDYQCWNDTACGAYGAKCYGVACGCAPPPPTVAPPPVPVGK